MKLTDTTRVLVTNRDRGESRVFTWAQVRNEMLHPDCREEMGRALVEPACGMLPGFVVGACLFELAPPASPKVEISTRGPKRAQWPAKRPRMADTRLPVDVERKHYAQAVTRVGIMQDAQHTAGYTVHGGTVLPKSTAADLRWLMREGWVRMERITFVWPKRDPAHGFLSSPEGMVSTWAKFVATEKGRAGYDALGK